MEHQFLKAGNQLHFNNYSWCEQNDSDDLRGGYAAYSKRFSMFYIEFNGAVIHSSKTYQAHKKRLDELFEKWHLGYEYVEDYFNPFEKRRAQFVVADGYAFGVIRPGSQSLEILSHSKESPWSTPFPEPTYWVGREIRLADSDDFVQFRQSERGFATDAHYKYIRMENTSTLKRSSQNLTAG